MDIKKIGLPITIEKEKYVVKDILFTALDTEQGENVHCLELEPGYKCYAFKYNYNLALPHVGSMNPTKILCWVSDISNEQNHDWQYGKELPGSQAVRFDVYAEDKLFKSILFMDKWLEFGNFGLISSTKNTAGLDYIRRAVMFNGVNFDVFSYEPETRQFGIYSGKDTLWSQMFLHPIWQSTKKHFDESVAWFRNFPEGHTHAVGEEKFDLLISQSIANADIEGFLESKSTEELVRYLVMWRPYFS